MEFIPAIKATKIYSDSGSEYIDIQKIQFTYNSDQTVSYNHIRLDSIVKKTEHTVYVQFNDIDQLQHVIGFRNFYILNQVYKFDPTITTHENSTLLFSSKSLDDLDILVDAIIDVYNGKINVRTSDYICLRLHNNCSISIYFSYVYNDTSEGYIIEIVHNQCVLYKEQFKTFVCDFTKLID
jgi:hypothetical protein